MTKGIGVVCLLLAVGSFVYGGYWMNQGRQGVVRSGETLMEAKMLLEQDSDEAQYEYETALRMSEIQSELAAEDEARSYPGFIVGVVLLMVAGFVFVKGKKV